MAVVLSSPTSNSSRVAVVAGGVASSDCSVAVASFTTGRGRCSLTALAQGANDQVKQLIVGVVGRPADGHGLVAAHIRQQQDKAGNHVLHPYRLESHLSVAGYGNHRRDTRQLGQSVEKRGPVPEENRRLQNGIRNAASLHMLLCVEARAKIRARLARHGIEAAEVDQMADARTLRGGNHLGCSLVVDLPVAGRGRLLDVGHQRGKVHRGVRACHQRGKRRRISDVAANDVDFGPQACGPGRTAGARGSVAAHLARRGALPDAGQCTRSRP